VEVEAGRCEDPVAQVDGSYVPLGQELERDPGPIRVEVSARGCKTDSEHFALAEGTRRPLVVRLEPLPSEQKKQHGVPAWVWYAAGGAAVVAGGIVSYELLTPSDPARTAAPVAGTWGRVAL
jgi:hypothetical protein